MSSNQLKHTFTIRYEKPKTIQEAYDRKDKLGAEIEQIQTQLGVRPNDTEWRKKAKMAILCKSEELRRIKTFIRTQTSQNNHFAELRSDLYEALDCLLEYYDHQVLSDKYIVKMLTVLAKHGYLHSDDELESDYRTPNDESSSLTSK